MGGLLSLFVPSVSGGLISFIAMIGILAAVALPAYQSRQMLETCELAGDNPDIALAANPIKFSETPTTTLGAHTAQVLAEFGIEMPARRDSR